MVTFPMSKIHQILQFGSLKYKEKLYFLEKLQNPTGLQVKHSGTKINFESSSNFKGVQTFLKKSDKFLKILSSHDILEYNFTLTHLYSKFGSYFTSGKNDLV
jgi:histidinol phosphatase-like PHP family hydrolase